MNTETIELTMDKAFDLFPAETDEGQNVRASQEAEVLARSALGVAAGVVLSWHLPDTFSVRYGSNYVGTAKAAGRSVRFLLDEGDFKEGDDK